MQSIQIIKFGENVGIYPDRTFNLPGCKKCKDCLLCDELLNHVICGSKDVIRGKVFSNRVNRYYEYYCDFVKE
jgi:hypothetical protein